MGRDARQQYAANLAWYNSASAADPRRDIQFTTGLGVTAERLDTIKRMFEQVVIDDGILHISFRGRLNTSQREQAIQKVIRQVVECKRAPALWVHKAMQNMLARAQSNMRKKIKVSGRSGVVYTVDAERGHAAATNNQDLSLLGHARDCSCNLERLVILLRRRQLDGTNSILSMDVASSLVSVSSVSQGLRTVEYQQLVKMFTDAGVDCDAEWIWAAHIDTMPIRNDGALRAALSRAVHCGAGQAVFTAIRKDGMQTSTVNIVLC
jgi:hypothetical protein